MSLVFKDGRGTGEIFTKHHDQTKLTATEKSRASVLDDKLKAGETLSFQEMGEIIKMRARAKRR